jgi:hypothetical protein
MADTAIVTSNAIDELHERYLAARQTLHESQKKFAALIAGYRDMPAALNTRLDCIEVTGAGMLAVNPPPAGPPWAQPATPAPRQVITRQEWPAIDDYIEAFSDLRRKLDEAERLYKSLPELDRQLGSKFRSPLEP